jgi:hypothetical protein
MQSYTESITDYHGFVDNPTVDVPFGYKRDGSNISAASAKEQFLSYLDSKIINNNTSVLGQTEFAELLHIQNGEQARVLFRAFQEMPNTNYVSVSQLRSKAGLFEKGDPEAKFDRK